MAIFDIDTFELVVVDSFKTNSKISTGERLRAIEQEFLKYMKIYTPHEVVIEKGFTQHNTATQQVYRVHGIANCRFWQYKQTELTTSQWAKIVTGIGKLDKDRVQDKIRQNKPHWKFKNDNESDAIGLGVAYLVKNYGMTWDLYGGIEEKVKKTRKKRASN